MASIQQSQAFLDEIRIAMQKRQWIDIPIDYSLAAGYFFCGLGQAWRPVQRITTTLFGEQAQMGGLFIGVALMTGAFVIWRIKPRGRVYLYYAIPLIAWCLLTFATIVGNPTSSLSTGAMVLGTVYLLFRTADKEDEIEKNAEINHDLVTLVQAQQVEISRLTTEIASRVEADEQRTTEPVS